MKNKKFIIGLILLISGLIFSLNFNGDGLDFLAGIMIGSGVAFLVSSLLKKNKSVE